MKIDWWSQAMFMEVQVQAKFSEKAHFNRIEKWTFCKHSCFTKPYNSLAFEEYPCHFVYIMNWSFQAPKDKNNKDHKMVCKIFDLPLIFCLIKVLQLILMPICQNDRLLNVPLYDVIVWLNPASAEQDQCQHHWLLSPAHWFVHVMFMREANAGLRRNQMIKMAPNTRRRCYHRLFEYLCHFNLNNSSVHLWRM